MERLSKVTLCLGVLGYLSWTLVFSGIWEQQGDGDERFHQIVQANNLGVARMEQLRFAEAAAEFEKVLELDAELIPVQVNLGIALFNQKEYDRAEEVLKSALALDGDPVRAHFMLGLIYQVRGQIDPAVSEFEKVLEMDPTDAATNYYLGVLLVGKQNTQKAIPYLQAVLNQQPYNASAHYNLGRALLREGRREEGQAVLRRFQELRSRFGTTTVGTQYLEQGKYAQALDQLPSRFSRSDVATTLVRFSDASRQSGLSHLRRGAGSMLPDFRTFSDFEQSFLSYIGGGVSVGDYDGDGWLDIFLGGSSGSSAGVLFHNNGRGRFQDVTEASALPVSPRVVGAIWGDYDNDGMLDAYLLQFGDNRLFRNTGGGVFEDVSAVTRAGSRLWSISGGFVDYDHDGDLDLFLAGFLDPNDLSFPASFPDSFQGSAHQLFRNNGNGSFSDMSEESGLNLPGKWLATGVRFSDFDNSRDIDVLVSNLDSGPQVFSNRRDGTFEDVSSNLGLANLPTGIWQVELGDVDGDGWIDFLLPPAPDHSMQLWMNQSGQSFSAMDVGFSGEPGVAYRVHLWDFDNDSDLDILAVGSTLFSTAPNHQNFYLFENRSGVFQDVSGVTGLDRYQSLPIRGLVVADYDRDGDLDLIVNVSEGYPLLLKNDGGNRNNWLQVRLQGVNSNRSGVGSKVEVKVGSRLQKREIRSDGGLFSGQAPKQAHFGIGRVGDVDFVRLLWPGGVLQSEAELEVNQSIELKELDRKGTSCPLLYVWDGTDFRFLTDFLGGSAFGYLVKPGVYNYPDSDEYIRLDRSWLRLREGKLAITLNNQLEEVIFFDRLQLVAVDHPGDFEVFADEKLLPGPPYSPFRILSAAAPRPPVNAWNDKGESVVDAVSRIDRHYPKLFDPLPYKGYATEHALRLDLGKVDPSRILLIMHAWIDYADSTSNLAASQGGLGLKPPIVEARASDGKWRTVLENMGFPAGLPKSLTVDLSGLLRPGESTIRIVTNMRIHWDQILVETSPARMDFRIHRIDAQVAQLAFKGFPRIVSPDGKAPDLYDYRNRSPWSGWKVHIGGYTRYGDVRELLSSIDDRFVITRSGDEIEASFDVQKLSELPPGWVRDFFVYVDGFGKDMDINSARPDTVGPLPFHAMSAYPYPEQEQYPDSPEHEKYLDEWNTRVVSGWIPRVGSDDPGAGPKIEAGGSGSSGSAGF